LKKSITARAFKSHSADLRIDQHVPYRITSITLKLLPSLLRALSCAQLGRAHIAKTGKTDKVLWRMMELKPEEQETAQVGKFA
jgi:hypothetical protein